MRISRRIACLFLACLLAATAGAQQPAAKKAPDVRVIIDISGSMKLNDPQNLRRPALELLVRLFPAGAKAGVWTFLSVAVALGVGEVELVPPRVHAEAKTTATVTNAIDQC